MEQWNNGAMEQWSNLNHDRQNNQNPHFLRSSKKNLRYGQ